MALDLSRLQAFDVAPLVQMDEAIGEAIRGEHADRRRRIEERKQKKLKKRKQVRRKKSDD